MSTTNIQIIASSELTSLVSTIREILRKENSIGAKSIITNGYVLNSAIRYLEGVANIDFSSIDYWEMINQFDLGDIITMNDENAAETMKFRLSALSNDTIIMISSSLSEAFGTRIRKNYIVKLILKSYLYERNNNKR